MWREGRGACCYGDALFTSSLGSYFSVNVLNIFVSIFCLYFLSVFFFFFLRKKGIIGHLHFILY